MAAPVDRTRHSKGCISSSPRWISKSGSRRGSRPDPETYLLLGLCSRFWPNETKVKPNETKT